MSIPGSRTSPIDLDDEEVEAIYGNAPPAVSPLPETIFLDEDLEDEDDFAADSGYDTEDNYNPVPTVLGPWVEVDEYPAGRDTIKVGDSIELTSTNENLDDEFLRVSHILFNVETLAYTLRGFKLSRTKAFKAFLGGSKANELILVLKVNDDDSRSPYIQGLEDVSPNDVLKKRSIVFTNKAFPALSWREDERYANSDFHGDHGRRLLQALNMDGQLVCRLVHIRFYASINHSRQDKVLRKGSGGEIRDLNESDLDMVRPATRDLGTSVATAIPIDGVGRNPRVTTAQQRRARGARSPKEYTFVDLFCGAGGVSSAAQQAGLKVLAGVDNWEVACRTWEENFPEGVAFVCDVADFLRNHATAYRDEVSLMHLSFPCQPFSAHKNYEHQPDEARVATLFTLDDILKVIRPRIATIEEVNTLWTRDRNLPFFRKIISLIFEAGYNVGWRIVNFRDTGASQNRKRLIIIASAPGEPLPEFAKPTHSNTYPTLPPLNCVGHILAQIPPHATMMDGHSGGARLEPRKEPYNALTTPLKNLITTGGGDNWHPNGLRRFYLRELAQLQGFPSSHKFEGTKSEITTQIGNAVPAAAFTPYVRNVIQALRDFDDGLLPHHEAQRQIPPSTFHLTSPAEALGLLMREGSGTEVERSSPRQVCQGNSHEAPIVIDDDDDVYFDDSWWTTDSDATIDNSPAPPKKRLRIA